MSNILAATWQWSRWGLQTCHALSRLKPVGPLTKRQCVHVYSSKSVSFKPTGFLWRQHDTIVPACGFHTVTLLHDKQAAPAQHAPFTGNPEPPPKLFQATPSSLQARYEQILASSTVPHPALHDSALKPHSSDPTSQLRHVQPVTDAWPEDDELPSQAQLKDIFGMTVDRSGAAALLSKLQIQRRDGTLDQPLPYPPVLLERGLAYLRSKYPVDEDAAIISRLDRELDGDWTLPQTNTSKSRTGNSGLMEIRKLNKAKRAAEEAKREYEEKEARRTQEERRRERQDKGVRGAQLVGGQTKGLSIADGSLGGIDSAGKALVLSERMENFITANDARIRASNAWVARYRRKATPQYIPQMTTWQRLWPCGCFSLCVVGLALIFAQVYIPPEQGARLFPDIPPAVAAVGTLVAINVAVFIAWKIPPLWPRLNRQFMVVPAIPQAFSMLGAEFSHSQLSHLTVNMVGLCLLGINCQYSVFLWYTIKVSTNYCVQYMMTSAEAHSSHLLPPAL